MTDEWDDFWIKRYTTPLGLLMQSVNVAVEYERFAEEVIMHSMKGPMLEVGCGDAMISGIIHERRGDKCFCIDNSPLAVKLARDLRRVRHIKGIKIEQADALGLPYKANRFDTAFSSGLLEHFDDPVPIIKEIRRVCKKQIAILPYHKGIWRLFKLLKRGRGEGENIAKLPFKYYNTKQLRLLFALSGYADVEVFTFWAIMPYVMIIADKGVP